MLTLTIARDARPIPQMAQLDAKRTLLRPFVPPSCCRLPPHDDGSPGTWIEALLPQQR